MKWGLIDDRDAMGPTTHVRRHDRACTLYTYIFINACFVGKRLIKFAYDEQRGGECDVQHTQSLVLICWLLYWQSLWLVSGWNDAAVDAARKYLQNLSYAYSMDMNNP